MVIHVELSQMMHAHVRQDFHTFKLQYYAKLGKNIVTELTKNSIIPKITCSTVIVRIPSCVVDLIYT